jgi:hypothetical protein
MNELGPILDAVAFGLAALLALIGFGAARRYADLRFALVGGAMSVLGALAALAIAGLLEPEVVPGSALGTVPAVLLILCEVLLYLSFVAPRNRSARDRPS